MTHTNGGAKFDPAASITRGKQAQPLRVLLYGPIGIGKSQWGAGAPHPLFICAESGSGHLNVARTHPPDWPAFLTTIRWLRTTPETFGTVVIDTIDWVEPMIIDFICRRDDGSADPTSRRPRKLIVDGKPSVAGYGWGHGYVVALEEWRILLAELDALRRERGTHVVLLAHVGTNRIGNEEGADYNMITPKINKNATGLLVEWCDAVLYADWEKYVLKAAEDPDSRAKIGTTGNRIVHTNTRGAHIAKGRELPEQLPLSWSAFYDAARRAFVDHAELLSVCAELRSNIAAHAPALPDDATRDKVVAAVQQAGDDPAALKRILARLVERTETAVVKN